MLLHPSLSRPPRPPTSTLFPYTTLFRSYTGRDPSSDRSGRAAERRAARAVPMDRRTLIRRFGRACLGDGRDRKSTRLNSSHLVISYAVFCLKKKSATIQVGGGDGGRRAG